ncbi:MAG TPA: helix-turn-helix transcriptional regulator [Streptosporangiaceae bacterium]
MVRESPDPTVSIYALMAYYLRFLRLKNQMTQTQVGEILGCTKGQVSKYEAGLRQLDERECAALDRAWDTGGLFAILRDYAKLAFDPNWYARYGRYQREATEQYIFAGDLIPLPFQAEGYIRSLLEAGHAAGLIDNVDGAVKKRMDQQRAVLDGRPEIWVVLDEIALRPMGTSEVMTAQRDRLIELGALPHISIRILPMSAAPHIGVDGSFRCFKLPGGRLAAFSGTALGMGRVIDDQREAASANLRFNRIAARAWSEDQSRDYLMELREDR